MLITYNVPGTALANGAKVQSQIDMTLALVGLPGDASGKVPSCQCRRHKRHRFDQEDALEKEMATHSSILA